ncbi:ankyrin repeat-containing domain protein [Aspergillus keveii]|uniref:Ankyrin repeat-containing domain protein n=1 Tax=Aspergillus keveii TaxID=714993 RepID=A0ABR4FMV8_9EURO
MSSILPPYIPRRPRAAELLDLPKELFIRISRFLSTKCLLSFVLVNREINQLCTLVLETPTAEGGELQRAIDWHATQKRGEAHADPPKQPTDVAETPRVAWLLDIGINPDIRSSDPNKETVLTEEGETSPLMAVALRNDTRFLAQFLTHVGKPTGYYLYDVMRMLFGFPANIKDHEGAQLLVGAGLDCGIVDGDGATALHYAAAYYSGEEVRFLAKQGLDIQAQAVGGAMPLAYAINASNVDTVEALCALEAPVNQQCTATNFPLALAARKGDPAIVKLLLDYDANPNLPNNLPGSNGEVPLNDASLSSADTPEISAMSEKSALALLHGGPH